VTNNPDQAFFSHLTLRNIVLVVVVVVIVVVLFFCAPYRRCDRYKARADDVNVSSWRDSAMFS